MKDLPRGIATAYGTVRAAIATALASISFQAMKHPVCYPNVRGITDKS
jgi:hypothetical protein